jgi:hypothetical protein
MDGYENGRWQYRQRGRGFMPPTPPVVRVQKGTRAELPDVGSDRVFVTYELDLGVSGGVFLADPVGLPSQGRAPVCGADEDSPRLLIFHPRDSVLLTPSDVKEGRAIRYQQVFKIGDDAEGQPAVGITESYYRRVLYQPVSGIRTWTWDTLNRLVAKGHLEHGDMTAIVHPQFAGERYLRLENHVKVARVLCQYLASSGEYLYRLEMRRSDLIADPTEDFLRNVKQGYCSHYATGLALMLRSVGIPSRVVSGYRGAQHQVDEDGVGAGRYIVRQSHAHSWVEALLTRRDADGSTENYWLMLDPTPSGELGAGAAISWTQWWALVRSTIRDLWSGMILDYNMDRQAQTMERVWDELTPSQDRLREIGIWVNEDVLSGSFWARNWLWVTLALGLAIGLAVIRGWKKKSGQLRPALLANEYGFYTRWINVVMRHARLRPATCANSARIRCRVRGNMATPADREPGRARWAARGGPLLPCSVRPTAPGRR